MKSAKITLLMLALSLMTGCNSSISPLVQVTPPSNLVTPCSELEGLPEGANLGDLLEVAISNNQAYMECKERHRKLSEWVQ